MALYTICMACELWSCSEQTMAVFRTQQMKPMDMEICPWELERLKRTSGSCPIIECIFVNIDMLSQSVRM